MAKSACAGAKAKLRKDEKHHASKATLKKDRKRVRTTCKKPGGGGTGGGGTGGGGTCTVTYAQFLGAAYQVSFQCTAPVSAFTVTTNKTLTYAVGRGSGPNHPFSCTMSAQSFTCTGPSARYYDLETQFNSNDACEPFTGTVTVNGKDYPFQGNCTPPEDG